MTNHELPFEAKVMFNKQFRDDSWVMGMASGIHTPKSLINYTYTCSDIHIVGFYEHTANEHSGTCRIDSRKTIFLVRTLISITM